MFKVRGTLQGGKAFKMDAKADLLHEAAVELQQKLERSSIDAEQVERVTFTARGAAEPELNVFEAPKRERKPSTGGKSRGASRKRNGRNAAAE